MWDLSSPTRDWTCVACLHWQADSLPLRHQGKTHVLLACLHAKFLPSCLILCNSMDCILPGSSVHGILLARILECVAMPSSKGSSWTKDWTWVSCSSCTADGFFTSEPLGNPHVLLTDYQIDENSLQGFQTCLESEHYYSLNFCFFQKTSSWEIWMF